MAIIAQSDGYMKQLQLFIEPKFNLRKHGFIVQPLTDEELLLKRRCVGCGKAMSQLKGRERNGPGHSTDDQIANTAKGFSQLNIAGADQEPKATLDALKAKAAPAPRFKCRFHPGVVANKYWSCCQQHCSAEPCSGSDFHEPRDESLAALAQHHQLYFTPVVRSQPASRAFGGKQDVRAAVALDCEMGTAESGDTELIKVTLIDYFTGEILVNNIVEPDVPLRHLNTRFSGITWAQMRAAQRKRTSLKATAGARNAIWKYVGDETVVVGHGVSNDLRSMKWIHEHVVDSFVIEFNIKKRREDKERMEEEEAIARAKADGTYVEPFMETEVPGESAKGGAVPPKQKRAKRKGGDLSLRTLADKRLGRKIQMGEGTTGHDSLEDAIAARDLVHWHITHPGTE